MNRKFVLIPFILAVSVLPFLSAQEISGEGERLYRLASEDLAYGRLTEALEKYERAAESLTGLNAQRCRLKVLQVKLELGRYEHLPSETLPLASEEMDPSVARGALMVEIKSLIKLGRGAEALPLMEGRSAELTSDPSSALGLSDAYRDLDMVNEAKRVEWIIKRDFPQSPEGLILTGRAERRMKPSLIIP